MQRNAAGFTLIELMITLVVVVVVTTLGLPAFADTLQRTRVSAASHSLSATLASARSTAVMRKEPVSVCPMTAQHRCRMDGVWEDGWMVFRDSQRSGQPAADSDILRVVDPLDRSLILRATSGRDRARFQPDGRSTGSTLTLSLCSADSHRLLGRVVLNNWGRARTERKPSRTAICSNIR
ncbi:MAG: GspH/FimT family pseudopilin [Lysobacter sp.]|nr:GspH/FimT family pseudopilin [Lysobacter sp.]